MSTPKSKPKSKPKASASTASKNTASKSPKKMSVAEKMKRLRLIVAYGISMGKSEPAIIGAVRAAKGADEIPLGTVWLTQDREMWFNIDRLIKKDLPVFAEAVQSYAQTPVVIERTRAFLEAAK